MHNPTILNKVVKKSTEDSPFTIENYLKAQYNIIKHLAECTELQDFNT